MNATEERNQLVTMALKVRHSKRQIQNIKREYRKRLKLEEECAREIADFFKRLEVRIHEIMEEYWESDLGLFHLNKVSDLIQDSRQEYYDILFKHCSIEYNRSREITERRFNRLLEGMSIKSDVSITRLGDLFKPDPTIRYNLNNKVFQASTHTMDRVDNLVMNSLSESYNDGVGIDEAKRRLTVKYNGLKSWEAQRIARTEINGAQNDAAFDVYGELGCEYHQWWTAQDERVRETANANHRALHGKIVKVGTAFSNGLMYPGDRQGRIAEWINCRCTTVPFLMPLGKMAPPGMTEFTEDDLIDIPNFKMPNVDDLIAGTAQIPQALREEYGRLANELMKNQIKAMTTGDYKKASEFESIMFRLIERFEKENVNWEEFVDYEYVSREIFKLQIRIDETESAYTRGMLEEAQESLLDFLGRNGINYDDYINESNRNAIMKEMELEWYEDNFMRSFGSGASDILPSQKVRMRTIEDAFPNETSAIARRLNPNSVDKLPKAEREFYHEYLRREGRGFSDYGNSKFKKLKRIVEDNSIIIEENVQTDFYGSYSMKYDGLKKENFHIIKFRDYDFDIYVGTEPKRNIGDVIEVLDKVPKKLLNQHKGKMIFSSSERVYSHHHKQYNGGWFSSYRNEIVIIDGFRDYGSRYDMKNLIGTIAHECGHRLDSNLGKVTMIGSDYYEIASVEGGFVSSYGRKGYEKFNTYYSEDFAEAVEMYVSDADRLKRNYPKRYEYIDNLFSNL